jgi:hypothetical protein
MNEREKNERIKYLEEMNEYLKAENRFLMDRIFLNVDLLFQANLKTQEENFALEQEKRVNELIMKHRRNEKSKN